MTKAPKTGVTVAASGYFDPLHVGHVEYLEKAKARGTKLVVIVNNDAQTKMKKGFSFMPQDERMKIVKALRCVDDVFLSIDNDKTVCKSLEAIRPDIFVKGGDRTAANLPSPEIDLCKKLGIKIEYGLGAKIQSSSELIARIIMLTSKENARKDETKI